MWPFNKKYVQTVKFGPNSQFLIKLPADTNKKAVKKFIKEFKKNLDKRIIIVSDNVKISIIKNSKGGNKICAQE